MTMSVYVDYIREKLEKADSMSVNEIRFLLIQIEEYGFRRRTQWECRALEEMVKQLQNILRERGEEDVQ